MGTTTKTSGSNTSSLQFNPQAQSMYNSLISSGGKQLQGYINNPFGNAMYQMGAGQSQRAAQQAGANNMGALNQNQLVQGLGGNAGAGFMNAMRSQTGRSNASMTSQAATSNVLAALQRQMAATGMGMSFSPQLTGQSGSFNQTQSTGGLGTWLPQVMGAAMGGLTGMSGFKSFASPTGGSVGGVSNSSLMTPNFAGGAMAGVNPGSLAAPSMSSVMSGQVPFGNAMMGMGFGNQYQNIGQ